MDKNVGFIGLGTMGLPMARNLLKDGFEVTVFNRTTSKSEKIRKDGATVANSPKDVAAGNAIIVTIVSDTPDVESVVLGRDGIVDGIKPGSIVIDMSTISPQATRRMALRLREKGCQMLDAPVSGGEQGAIDATLSIMVGGEAETIERCMSVLKAMGKTIVHVGPNGMGQTVKLMNQILVAGTLNAVVEALIFAKKQNVDLEKAIDAVKGGAAGSWQLANLGQRMIKRDFRPGFKVRLIKKDLKLAMEAAAEYGTPLPVTSLVQQMFCSLPEAEWDSGTQALVKALERLSGSEVRQDD
jgi:2-hydroxy-3-oxopropionate reductase